MAWLQTQTSLKPSSASNSAHWLSLPWKLSMLPVAKFQFLHMYKFLESLLIANYLSLNKYVATLSKAYYFHNRALRHIWNALTDESAKSITCALVGSRLDYAKALFIGASASTLPNANRSRTCWRVSSLVNTDGLEHLNLLLLVMGCQSSGKLISRSPQFLTNFSRPVNLSTWPTQYLNMTEVNRWVYIVSPSHKNSYRCARFLVCRSIRLESTTGRH